MSRILRYETGSCVQNVLMMDSEDRTSYQHDAYSIAAVITFDNNKYDEQQDKRRDA